MGDLGLIPGSGRSLGGGHGNSLQYSCLENPHGQRSLVDCSPQGCKESDMTEWVSTHAHTQAVTKSDAYEDYGMTWNKTGYKIQWILMICGLHTCELAYLLKCICSSKSIPTALWSHSLPCVELRTIWVIWCQCALLSLNKSLCLLVSVLKLWASIPVECLFSDMVSEFLCFFWWFHCFKWSSNCAA